MTGFYNMKVQLTWYLLKYDIKHVISDSIQLSISFLVFSNATYDNLLCLSSFEII